VITSYGDDVTGCSRNASFALPPSKLVGALLLARAGGCAIEERLNLTQSLALSMLVIYNTRLNQSLSDLSDISNVNGTNGSYADIPVLVLDYDTGTFLRQLLATAERGGSSSRVRIVGTDDISNSPNIWEFTLLVIVILLGLSLLVSVVMHYYVYRNRDIQQRRAEEAAIEEHRRLTTLTNEDLAKYPVKVFRKESRRYPGQDEVMKFTSPKSVGAADVMLEMQSRPDTSESALSVTPLTRSHSLPEVLEGVDLTDSSLIHAHRGNSIGSIHTLLVDSCPICLEDFEEGDQLRGLSCGHYFHLPCVDPWLTTKNAVCPMCKHILYVMPSPVMVPSITPDSTTMTFGNVEDEAVDWSGQAV
jgi:hypothetical protein